MPFDINEDRQLRVIWSKYEIQIRDLKSYFRKNELINPIPFRYNRISNTIFEKQLELDTLIRELEEKRRKEMKETRTVVRNKKKMELEKEKVELEKGNCRKETRYPRIT